MTGADEVVAARMRRVPVAAVFVGVWDRRPSVRVLGDVDVMPGDAAATLDLRCVAGLPVVGDGTASTDRKLAVFTRGCDFMPAKVVLVADDLIAEFDPKKGVREWAQAT